MRTGCRCRKMFDSITSTRVRSVSGRSPAFQTCVSVSQFQNSVPLLPFGATFTAPPGAVATAAPTVATAGRRLAALASPTIPINAITTPINRATPSGSKTAKTKITSTCALPLRLQKRFWISPLAQFFLEVAALVDEDLPIVGEHDACALERTWRRALEVDATQVIAAAVAGTLEFVFRREVVRRATQMRADRDERVKTTGMHDVVVGSLDDPDAEL